MTIRDFLRTETEEALRQMASDMQDRLHAVEQELRRRGVQDHCYITGTHPDGYKCEKCDGVLQPWRP